MLMNFEKRTGDGLNIITLKRERVMLASKHHVEEQTFTEDSKHLCANDFAKLDFYGKSTSMLNVLNRPT